MASISSRAEGSGIEGWYRCSCDGSVTKKGKLMASSLIRTYIFFSPLVSCALGVTVFHMVNRLASLKEVFMEVFFPLVAVSARILARKSSYPR